VENFSHRFLTTNGIKMHLAEAGAGPLVLLCHGFPESWYSWRHQLRALGDAGFHAIAPDMRGYGQTDRPKEVEAYDIFQLTGDLVGLVNAMGGGPTVIVGHDWGAWITQAAALFRPDLFRAVALLSVPFLPRASISPSAWEQQKYPGQIFYQQIFRSPVQSRSSRPMCAGRSLMLSTRRRANLLPTSAGNSQSISKTRRT
jgi:epoxide hydrolase A/B